jgi:quinol monooxygenase YgiN
MYITILKLKLSMPNKKAAIAIFKSLQESLSTKQGCTGCGAYDSVEAPGQFFYIEQWTSKQALYRHIQSDLYRTVLSVIDLASEPPEISFHETVQVGGMELIEDLREARVRPIRLVPDKGSA